MKSTFLKWLKWSGIALGSLFVLGIAISVIDPEGTKRRAEEAKQRAEAKAAEKGKVDPVFQHGFAVGFTSAQSGAVKPTAEELDAHARRAAVHLGEQGGLGFKTQWKNGFWAGWAKGD